jgi:hypothetical protein
MEFASMDDDTDDRFERLTALISALARDYETDSLVYATVVNFAQSGKIPAVQLTNHIWHFATKDRHKIAVALGLRRRADIQNEVSA